MTSLIFEHEPTAKSLRFSGDRMFVLLTDGREINVPLDFYPTLASMSPRERKNFKRIGPGVGFEWPDYDLDLSVRGFLEGRREHVPPVAYRKKHPRPVDSRAHHKQSWIRPSAPGSWSKRSSRSTAARSRSSK